ncbi:hypothetical protein EBU95_18855, partial [bacterium]|nr:hypothetical protein [bacterium]
MGLVDFDKVMKEYANVEDDFGFSAVSEAEYNAVIKNLDDVIPANTRIIFSPNYYNYPKDPAITLNYVYIRKDMRNMPLLSNKSVSA